MVKALFDTCILIDYLNGNPAAKAELARYQDKAISAVTWMEVMVGTTADNEALTQQWLDTSFQQIELSREISFQAVQVRKAKRLKLPDAIIYASAQNSGRLLVTRNTKDFVADDPVVRIPY